MKIIDIAVCDDNKDPKGLGRIRYKLHSSGGGAKEKAVDYEKWGETDLFVAQPFLPLNINFIPEIGQAVKIIRYDVNKESVNQEYIAGPFGNPYDFNNTVLSSQLQNTTYGSIAKKSPDIYKNGEIDERYKAAFTEINHYGVYGKYGSDLIFTDNGLQLRGGKLLSKEAASSKNRETLINFPIMSKKSSRIYLKKFPKVMELKPVEEKTEKVQFAVLKTIIEYSLDSLTNPQFVNIYMYDVEKPYGNLYNTNSFNEHTELDFNYLKLYTLSGNTPTLTLPIPPSPPSLTPTINDAYLFLRDGFKKIIENGPFSLNPLYRKTTDLYPLYFRPTKEFRERVGNNTEKLKFLDNVFIRNKKTSGLIWSFTQVDPQVIPNVEIKLKPFVNENSSEQTFGSILSDKIFLLSTEYSLGTPGGSPNINFEGLSKYDLTQEDYISKIEPSTYATVRGEKLLEFLFALKEVLYGHVHNINKTYIKEWDEHENLDRLYQSLANDLLNTSIRIN
jgi:hypothetical protein